MCRLWLVYGKYVMKLKPFTANTSDILFMAIPCALRRTMLSAIAKSSGGSSAASPSQQFVAVFAGSRDQYQVAIALAEAGRLYTLVNELYLPSLPSWVRRAIAVCDRKNHRAARVSENLPGNLVTTSWIALGASALNRIKPSPRLIRLQDAALGRVCGRVAGIRRLPALAYSYYASYAFEEMPPDLLRIIFQVHPHPQSVRRILSDELAISPWARDSLMAEHELNLPQEDLNRLSRESCDAHFAVTPSTFAKQSLLEANVSSDRIAVVPYGIDNAIFAPKKYSDHGNRPMRLIFVGSLVQRKGLGYLLAAMRRVRGQPIELVLVGRGARDDALLAQFSDVPFRLAWNISRSELVRELQAADVFILPSLAESFAHVILEAMAVGLPVVTTTNTAGPDLLEEGRTGFVGAIRDVDFVVEKIQWFLANRDALATMGRACQEEAARRTWPRFRAEIRLAIEQFQRQWLLSA